MKLEIKELIEVAEKRRVDKFSIIANILETRFFRKLIQANTDCKEYIKVLEDKLLTCAKNFENF